VDHYLGDERGGGQARRWPALPEAGSPLAHVGEAENRSRSEDMCSDIGKERTGKEEVEREKEAIRSIPLMRWGRRRRNWTVRNRTS